MPHIIVKMWPGRTEEQKVEFTKSVVQAAAEILGAKESSITVGIEEIPSERWQEEVVTPEILEKENTLYKKRGSVPPESPVK